MTGAGGPCHTGCRIRVEQQCGGWCKGVYDCDSCKAALKTQGAADDDEGLEDACSEEGKCPTDVNRINSLTYV